MRGGKRRRSRKIRSKGGDRMDVAEWVELGQWQNDERWKKKREWKKDKRIIWGGWEKDERRRTIMMMMMKKERGCWEDERMIKREIEWEEWNDKGVDL